jgi:2-polyprenyl-3-methyl-5-hydroxy-6-metoxy-1,4-benzoquinol methylase
MTGDTNAATSQRIERACQVVAKAVNQDSGGLCLDVGCGFGVFVPFLYAPGSLLPKFMGLI